MTKSTCKRVSSVSMAKLYYSRELPFSDDYREIDVSVRTSKKR
jgi:hypothetical protein